MKLEPLDYSTPAKRRPYSRAAIFSSAASAISGPLGAQSERFPALPQSVWLTIRFLPVGAAVLFGLVTFWRFEPRRDRYRGLWLVGLGLVIDLFWFLCLASAPI
jgi:hypothetical protein